eukprot:gb/GECG01000156.1/.p1 GENE.gb/GECG01000156.1/~~gb/GECG01000156.1/.p1  ORF type:complete len:470 (+),score=45.66 gb/GECG01000156.1/:1-1410(+)
MRRQTLSIASKCRRRPQLPATGGADMSSHKLYSATASMCMMRGIRVMSTAQAAPATTATSESTRSSRREEAWKKLRSRDPAEDIAAFFGPQAVPSVERSTAPKKDTTNAERGMPKPSSDKYLYDKFRRKHTYLRVSLTEKCNLRCKYCMPADGVDLTEKEKLLSHEELIELIRHFASAGVNKVRFTGGEPLVRPDIARIVEDTVKQTGITNIGITTNGVTLEKKLQPLVDAGLKHINISLDTLKRDRFTYISRRPQAAHDKTMHAIESAIQHLGRLESVKVNVVLMRNVNDDELLDFVEYTRNLPVDVRFIEFMPFAANDWEDPSFISYSEQLQRIQKEFPDIQKISTDPYSTAVEWQVPGFSGTVGFIASMSKPFCGGCTRIRLTADGFLKTCLFGTDETNLRDPLRSGASREELLSILHGSLGRKHKMLGGFGDRFGISDALHNPTNKSSESSDVRDIHRPMTTIGG